MSITNPAKHLPRASRRTRGPEFAFAGTLLVAFAAMVAGTKMLPSDLVLPVVSTIFFVLACLVALVASLHDRACEQSRMTYWDVAGALTLFGICVASQVDAEQMVRFVEGTHHRH
ncbi:MAG TPA: hypothetical protein VI077_12920 [Pseudolabrys sp.]